MEWEYLPLEGQIEVAQEQYWTVMGGILAAYVAVLVSSWCWKGWGDLA